METASNVFENAGNAQQIPFGLGTAIKNRGWPWPVDAQEKDVLLSTAIDPRELEHDRFCIRLQGIRLGRLPPPSPDAAGRIDVQNLLRRAYRLNHQHDRVRLVSLQRSRVIPKNYHLVPVVMALEMPRMCMLQADEVQDQKIVPVAQRQNSTADKLCMLPKDRRYHA